MLSTRRLCTAMALTSSLAALMVGLAPASVDAAGDEVRKLTLVSRAQAANPQQYQAAELIAQIWRKLGLDVEVQGLPRPQQSDLVWYNRDKWDVTMWQMVSRPERSDPDEFTYNLFHSSTAPKGYNFVGYTNPDYDAVAEEQRRTMDKDARQALVVKAQELIAADQPYAYLVHPLKVYAYDNTIWTDGSFVEQAGLGIKNIWSFLNAEPAGDVKDMILNSSDELNAINPFYISGATDSWITELIWDRVMRIGPDGLPQPWAAESVTWQDETTVDIVLREGMTWHDGQPVTTDDIIFSFSAPAEGTNAPMYQPFVTQITNMEATDDRTVRMTLEAPNAAFETSTLAKLNIAPKHVWEPLLANLNEGETAEAVLEESRIGSGPFRFARWVTQQEVVLEANTDHWAAPKLERWIVRIVPNAEASFGMLRSGEVNFMSDYTGDPQLLIDAAAEDGDLTVVDSVDIGFQYVAFNNRRAPFDDAAFRNALSLSIDRDLLMAAAWSGFAVKANSHVSPALDFWHAKGITDFETGVELAQGMLEEAGYELVDGKLHYPDGGTEAYAE